MLPCNKNFALALADKFTNKTTSPLGDVPLCAARNRPIWYVDKIKIINKTKKDKIKTLSIDLVVKTQ